MGRKKKYATEEERIEAKKTYLKQWREANREKMLEQKKQYYQANKDKRLEYAKQYNQANKEKRLEYQKQWYQANRENMLEQMKQYYQANMEKRLKYQKQYNKANKEKMLEKQKQYYKTPMGRAHSLVSSYNRNDKKANRGECTLTTKWIVNNIFSSKCIYCGESDWKKLGCDRIDNSLPHTEDNVVPCCEECNKKRGTKSYEEFLAEIKKEYN